MGNERPKSRAAMVQHRTGTVQGTNSGRPAKRRVQVDDIMGGGREVTLLFNDTEYNLRITNNEKLILTK